VSSEALHILAGSPPWGEQNGGQDDPPGNQPARHIDTRRQVELLLSGTQLEEPSTTLSIITAPWHLYLRHDDTPAGFSADFPDNNRIFAAA